MPTRIFSAYNAVLAQIKAAVPLLDNVGDVFDGPQGGTIATDLDLVFVGCDDPLTTSTVLAVDVGQQDWLDLGGFDKKETFLVWCSYVAWTGDSNDYATCRARAQANLALIEAQFRPGPTSVADGMLGTLTVPGPLAPDGYCNLSISRLQQIATVAGPAVHVPFMIACQAYLQT